MPDLVFVCKGEFLFEFTQKYLKLLRIKTAVWSHEDVFKIFISKKLELLKKIDFLFVSDSEICGKLKNFGFENAKFLEAAYRLKLSTDKKIKNIPDSDVIFVGKFSQHNLKIIESFADLNIKLVLAGGFSWKKSKILRQKALILPKMRLSKIFQYCQKSKICINIQNPDLPNSLNTLTFEICGNAFFQITDYKKDVDNIFSVGKDLICFNNLGELKNYIVHYLAYHNDRKNIRLSGAETALQKHTYENRMKKVFKQIFGD